MFVKLQSGQPFQSAALATSGFICIRVGKSLRSKRVKRYADKLRRCHVSPASSFFADFQQ
jgi:hypothetical protein